MSYPKRVHYVDLGNGAQASMPTADLSWLLRYNVSEDHNLCAAECIDTLRYIVLSCTAREQRRRLKLMKDAVLAQVAKGDRDGD